MHQYYILRFMSTYDMQLFVHDTIHIAYHMILKTVPKILLYNVNYYDKKVNYYYCYNVNYYTMHPKILLYNVMD